MRGTALHGGCGWLIVAAIALALAAPATAAPTWSEPFELAGPNQGGPAVAMDARGNALVVWQERWGDGSMSYTGSRSASSYRWWIPGEGWTETRRFPRETGYIAGFAITPLGEATVLIRGSGAENVPLAIGSVSPGGAVRDLQPLSEAAYVGVPPAMGMDDAGNAVVAWAEAGRPPELHVANRRAGAAPGRPVSLGPTGSFLQVAVNPAGAAAVSWMDSTRSRVSYRPAGGSFGPPEDPGFPGVSVLAGTAVDHAGNLVLGSNVGGFPPGEDAGTYYAARTPLGDWSTPERLEPRRYPSSMLVDSRGAAIFSISGSGEGNRGGHLLTRHLDGRIDREVLTPDDAGARTLAMNTRGDLLAAWGPSFFAEDPPKRIALRERPLGSPEFGEEDVLAAGFPGSLSAALNDLGQAMVAWAEIERGPDGLRSPGLRAAVRDDSALRAVPAPPDAEIYSDPLATLDSDGDLLAPVACSVSCKVRATGIVFPGGEAKALAGAGPSQRLKPRRRTKVKLDFGAEGRRAVKAALAAGQKPWVSVSVSARGKSPRPYAVSRRFKIRR